MIYTYLRGHGLERNKSDRNLYHRNENGKCVILVLYVDDLLITRSNTFGIKKLQSHLENVFEIYSSWFLCRYLVVDFVYVEQGIFMIQKHYIESMLKDFGIYDYKPKKTPMVQALKIVVVMDTKEMDVTK